MDIITDERHNKLAEAQQEQAESTQAVEELLEAIRTKNQYGECDHDLNLVDRLNHLRCRSLEETLKTQAKEDAEACRLLAELTQEAEDED